MMKLGESIPTSELGAPKIVVDYLKGDSKLSAFFRSLPKLSDFEKLSLRNPLSETERKKVSATLVEYQKKWGGSTNSIRNASKLAEENVFAIVSGQQPGFLGGPVFNLLKAATAVRLARDLAKKGLPVVPVFWNHSEDHDLEETNHVYLPNSNYDLQKFRLPYPTAKKFLFDVKLDSAADSVFEAALSTLPQSEFLKDCSELLRPRAGNSLSEEFSRILLQLFAEDGLVIVEPQLLRETSAKALVKLLRTTPSLEKTLEQTRSKLKKLGYEITIAEDQALLFERHQEQRLKVEKDGDRWLLPSGKKLSSAELASEIEKEPARFSPGALLRPLTQCNTLPVAAYVGGPAELAYSAENFDLFSLVQIQPPFLLPRFSATFVEPAIEKILQKQKLSPKAAMASVEELEKKFPPPELHSVAELSQLREHLEKQLRSLEGELRSLDASLMGPLAKTRESVASNLSKLQEKINNAARNQSGAGQRQLKKLSALMHPLERPQERVISPLYFFARHGLSFCKELLEILDPFEIDHRIVYLNR